jgi:FkbM family methyltransferase
MLPHGVHQANAYAHRFASFGLSRREALLASLSARRRGLLDGTMLDVLPAAVRCRPDLVVDVGANAGAWSEAAAVLLRPRALVAFEPSEQSYRQLRARLVRYPGVQTRRLALSDSPARATLFRFDRSEFDSLRPADTELSVTYGVASAGSETVDVATLDDSLEELGLTGEVSLLKVDVQGSELAVLRGAARALERCRCVFLEVLFSPHYDGQASFEELHEFMRCGAGFRLHRFGTLATDRAGDLKWADAVYVRNAGGNE